MTEIKSVFIKDIKEQADGRMKLIISDGTLNGNIEITDLAVCCHAKFFEIEDSFVYEIYFEKVKK